MAASVLPQIIVRYGDPDLSFEVNNILMEQSFIGEALHHFLVQPVLTGLN